MSSFYAELTVAGGTYPVRRCEFEFAQATDARGRVQAKVRHGLLYLVLDVPATDQLLAWAQAAYKPLAGHVTFFETNRRSARETVSFAAGQCVGYEEIFEVGDGSAGAYVCQLTITTTGLVLVPGGPAGAFVAPAARDYAAPVAVATNAPAAVQRLPLITGHPPFTVKGASKSKPGLDRVEFVRQLTNQQAGLNRLTVAQFLANRKHYEDLRKLTGSGRDPKGDAAQKVAREEALAEKILESRRQDRQLSRAQATAQAEQWISTQAALHDPDQVAGGHPETITGVGDARTNYALGALWPKRIKGIESQVRSYAATMSPAEQGVTYLNIELPVA